MISRITASLFSNLPLVILTTRPTWTNLLNKKEPLFGDVFFTGVDILSKRTSALAARRRYAQIIAIIYSKHKT